MWGGEGRACGFLRYLEELTGAPRRDGAGKGHCRAVIHPQLAPPQAQDGVPRADDELPPPHAGPQEGLC